MTPSLTPPPVLRRRHIFSGQVQGVGFRPFIYGLATTYELSGFVKNTADGVVVELQGQEKNLAAFTHAVTHALPPLARVTRHEESPVPPLAGEQGFHIKKSSAAAGHAVLISPDMATCEDCQKDITTPGNPRFAYAFTNCTNCGPRYTITHSIPYDRATTSMACFPLCQKCQAEYENPLNRRFHAQPNACPVCGPQLWFITAGQAQIPYATQFSPAAQHNALPRLAQFLATGGIAAIKGLGGFHLACLATDTEALTRLRQAKNRPHKPFAVMVGNLAEARKVAQIGQGEEDLLVARERPIVLCPTKPGLLSPLISPDTPLVGLMLPYTPLHILLLQNLQALLAPQGKTAALVMTSGNRGGEPICLGNREALNRLCGIAEAFCLHNRDILIRVDDSVVRPVPGIHAGLAASPPLAAKTQVMLYRRARGFVPSPLAMPCPVEDLAPFTVLAVGADLKNTLCLTKGNEAFVSQHIGDMENAETMAFHQEIAAHLQKLLQVTPTLVVHDAHPNFLSSRLAQETGLPVHSLQHHKSHAFAVLGENLHTGPALCLTLDGTGLGDDGTLWGGEAILADACTGTAHRVGSFTPFALPGGEAAIRQPWRIAHALLLGIHNTPQGATPPSLPSMPWMPEFAQATALLSQMLEKNINTPLTSSCGRLFDAIAALLGLCLTTTYEGQAAIRLEQAQHTPVTEICPEPPLPSSCLTRHNGLLCISSQAIFADIALARSRGVTTPALAQRFHRVLIDSLVKLAVQLCQEHSLSHVGLSGGCFHNLTLLQGVSQGLAAHSITPLMHHVLPPGDGCIAYGQAVWGKTLRLPREQ